jgi:cytochrome c-type biogenesis protein CcmH
MTGFVIAAAVAVVVTLLLLLRPFLWRRAEAATASHRQLNAAIYRDQFAELERDRQEGTLSEADFEQARTELQRRMLEDGRDDEIVAAARAPKKTMLAVIVAVPVAAVAFYLAIGNPAGLNPQAAPPEHRVGADEIERMVSGLAAKLEQEPDNLQGWVMLARSYKVLGRLPEAVKAFERAGKLVDGDAQLLAEYADLSIAVNGGSFAGKPTMLIDKALKVDPNNLQALWLKGTGAFVEGRYDQAVAVWSRLEKLLPAGSDDAKQIAAGIEEARAKGGLKRGGGVEQLRR